MMTAITVTVRMYHVGFGDCFLVTVTRGGAVWRMLIDCGVHALDRVAPPIRASVTGIIGDLCAMSADGIPRLDVIVATHRHADHISGFALDEWEAVHVGEVWLPFTEDETDADAAALRRRQDECARQLIALIRERTPASIDDESAAGTALGLAMNSLSNADATDRLLGRNDRRFANTPRLRFLPGRDDAGNVIPLSIESAVVHVLGPSRDPSHLKRMDPPRSVGWLQLDLDTPLTGTPTKPTPVFAPEYHVEDPRELPAGLKSARERIDFSLGEHLLGATSVLERSVNNTSLFLVFDIAGARLIFCGDAQYGEWEHVLENADNRTLMKNAVLYKIGHHGSHNATPKAFIQDIWQEGALAMLSCGHVERWAETIPKKALMEALLARHHTIIRSDAHETYPPNITVHEDRWSEVTFTSTGSMTLTD